MVIEAERVLVPFERELERWHRSQERQSLWSERLGSHRACESAQRVSHDAGDRTVPFSDGDDEASEFASICGPARGRTMRLGVERRHAKPHVDERIRQGRELTSRTGPAVAENDERSFPLHSEETMATTVRDRLEKSVGRVESRSSAPGNQESIGKKGCAQRRE